MLAPIGFRRFRWQTVLLSQLQLANFPLRVG